MNYCKKIIFNLLIVLFGVILCSNSAIEVKASEIFEELQVGVGAVVDGDIIIEPEVVNELAAKKERAIKKATEKEELISSLVMADVDKVLNVRTEPKQDSPVLGQLYKDCGGTLIEEIEGWAKIKSDELEGWVNSEYLYFGEEAAAAAQELGRYIAVVDADALRVREDKSEESGIMGLVSKGERVDVYEEGDEWIGIEYEGEIGYLSSIYLDVEFEIDTGETLEQIEERERREEEYRQSLIQNNGSTSANASELDLLAALIYCESGGEPYEGQVAVGAVVMNRVKSPAYPNTIAGVIFASGQFTPALNGKVEQRIAIGSPANCYEAAKQALSGYSNVGDMTHFRRKGNKEGFIIGNHVFY